MNIDKIYKPLSLYRNDEGIPYYDTLEVEELEEKYKELLKDRIAPLLKNIKLGLGPNMFKLIYADDIDMIERLTGMKWEDIIK